MRKKYIPMVYLGQIGTEMPPLRMKRDDTRLHEIL
jgi:hypothetical protein